MKKYSFVLDGHATSVSLEPIFMEAVKRLASIQRVSVQEWIRQVDAYRADQKIAVGLSSFLRQLVLVRFMEDPVLQQTEVFRNLKNFFQREESKIHADFSKEQ